MTVRFNPPPNWPKPPEGWVPPPGWNPDPSWPPPPDGWPLWLPDNDANAAGTPVPTASEAAPATASATDAAPQHDTAGLLVRIAELEAQLAASGRHSPDVIELNDQKVLQDVGIYRYHHPLENAALYKERLAQFDAQIDEVVKAGKAVLAADMFTFNGSLAKGRKMVARPVQADVAGLQRRGRQLRSFSAVRQHQHCHPQARGCDGLDRKAWRDYGDESQSRSITRCALRSSNSQLTTR